MSDMDELTKAAQEVTHHIMRNREKYVEAFVAETGLLPSQCKIVEKIGVDDNGFLVTSVFVMKLEGEENDVRYQGLRSLIQRMAEVGDELRAIANNNDFCCPTRERFICSMNTEGTENDHDDDCPVTKWETIKKEMEG